MGWVVGGERGRREEECGQLVLCFLAVIRCGIFFVFTFCLESEGAEISGLYFFFCIILGSWVIWFGCARSLGMQGDGGGVLDVVFFFFQIFLLGRMCVLPHVYARKRRVGSEEC